MQLQLKSVRKENGISQSELAKRLGIDIKTIGNWERGKTLPNIEQIWNCAVALDSTPNDLMGWYIDHPREESTPAPQGGSQLMSAYNALSEEGREVAVNVVSGLTATYPQGLDTDDVGEETA